MLERHPEIGFRMLDSLSIEPVATGCATITSAGTGAAIRRGSGDVIPLGARIIFVADAFDAMTSDRTYRFAMPPEHALAELEDCAGSQFDRASSRR